MKRDLYFKELALVLGRVGFTSLSQENDSLPVEYQYFLPSGGCELV